VPYSPNHGTQRKEVKTRSHECFTKDGYIEKTLLLFSKIG